MKRPTNPEQGAVDNEEQGGGEGVGQEGDGIERQRASIIIFVLFAPHLCGSFFSNIMLGTLQTVPQKRISNHCSVQVHISYLVLTNNIWC